MTRAIRWGILGSAKFALEQMAPAIATSRNAELVAVASRSAASAAPFAELFPSIRVIEGYEALLAAPDIDAVYIPLPNAMHIEWSLRALEAGKHVLCEKPIALKAEQIDPLIAARDRTGLLAAEAYMIVHHPQWQKTRDLVAAGAIGDLVHVEGLFGYNNAEDTTNIRNRADTGGGVIGDIGVYTFGATRFVTGQEPLEITHADLSFENGVDVTTRVAARFDGFTAHWLNSMRIHPAQEMVFLGSHGTIRLTAPFNPMSFGEATVELTAGDGMHRWTWPHDNHYIRQVEAFGRSVTDGAPYAWPLEQARATQAMIDRVFAKGASDPT